ncbi:MAG: PTS sugar transporter subunit IIC [Smithellaceae bacterium]|nr:PTS sugar transporter subunit IIC [Smithellaceae bacterium]
MIGKVFIISLIGALLATDRILVQTMVSRPIVTAPLIGLLLGDPYSGLVIGALLELLWVDLIPMGGYVPPNDTLVAVLAVGVALTVPLEGRHTTAEINAASLLLCVPFGYLGKRMDCLLIQRNERTAGEAFAYAVEGEIQGVDALQYRALARAYVANAAFLFAAALVCIKIMKMLLSSTPPYLWKSMLIVYVVLPLLGVTAAINATKIRNKVPLFCLLLVLGTLVWELLHGMH